MQFIQSGLSNSVQLFGTEYHNTLAFKEPPETRGAVLERGTITNEICIDRLICFDCSIWLSAWFSSEYNFLGFFLDHAAKKFWPSIEDLDKCSTFIEDKPNCSKRKQFVAEPEFDFSFFHFHAYSKSGADLGFSRRVGGADFWKFWRPFLSEFSSEAVKIRYFGQIFCAFFRHFLENFDKRSRFFGTRSPSSLVYIGANGAARYILGSVGHNWTSLKVSNREPFGSKGGRIPEETASTLPLPPPPPNSTPSRNYKTTHNLIKFINEKISSK